MLNISAKHNRLKGLMIRILQTNKDHLALWECCEAYFLHYRISHPNISFIPLLHNLYLTQTYTPNSVRHFAKETIHPVEKHNLLLSKLKSEE